MSVRVLPPEVADQIAAGEVVERPASVVKELIENSLDAGAKSIDIVVEEGGHKLIRVSDDGCGMSPEDAQLALVRHATSKISSAADIEAVATFGFRGEALPAIASISRFELETADVEGEGVLIAHDGGTAGAQRRVTRRCGTTVHVGQLFHNVPARRKFMRSARSEWRAMADVIAATALTRLDVRFSVTHDGRVVLTLPAARTLRDRIAAIWGTKCAASLLEVDHVAGTFHVWGLVERPSEVGTASRRAFVAVNGRPVRDAGVVRAAEAAYRSTIPAGVRPTLFLDIELPRELVDVNVHPAKAEVRLRDRWPVERAVEAAVRRAIGSFEAAAYLSSTNDHPGWRTWRPPSAQSTAYEPAVPFSSGRDTVDEVQTAITAPRLDVASPPEQIPPLFQFRRTYIVFEHIDGLVLIDQHSAHERVLYEQFMRALEQGGAPSQRLLIPLTLHMGAAEADACDANHEYLERLGFEIERFGGSTLIVSSVPTPHRRFDAERCLRETLDALTGDRMAGTATRHEHLAATVACKAAVKAGDELSHEEMRSLFASLRETDLPAHDVHGRSTIVQLSWAELERRFGRR